LPVSCAQLHQYSPNLAEWDAADFSADVVGDTRWLRGHTACCGAISWMLRQSEHRGPGGMIKV
jgi:hypothetical protein